MTPEGYATIIGALGLIFIQLYAMYLNSKNANRAEAAVKENTTITQDIRVAQSVQNERTNGTLTKLMDTATQAAHVAGKAAGIAETKAESKAEGKKK